MKQLKKFFHNINQIELITIEYNNWNGFIFTILSIEYQGKNKGFQGDLIGLHFSATHFIVYLAFIEFEIKSPFLK